MKRPYSLAYKIFYRIPLCLVKIARNYRDLIGNARSNTYYGDAPLKSRSQILLDQIYSSCKYGFTLDDYYAMGIDQKGKNVRDYIQDVMNGVSLYALDSSYDVDYKTRPYDHICTLRDKWIFSQLAESYGLSIPATYGLIKNGAFVKGNPSWLSGFEDLASRERTVLFKPLEGSCGVGIFRVRSEAGKMYLHGKEISCSELEQMVRGGDFLIQEFVRNQHPAMSALYPNALNTLRITTARRGDSVEVMGCMCMLGAHGTDCSNWHFGGVAVNLKEDGTLDKYGFCKIDKRIVAHPDTGIVFEGYQIPFFDAAIALAKKASGLFYGFRSYGWDIAITEEGPIIIEGNDDWGIVAHQMVENRGWRDLWESYHGKMVL